MIDTELKDLLRKAYKAGRRNALKQDEANFNDFINKHESRLDLFAIPDVVGQSEQLVSFLRQYQKSCEIMHVNKIDAKNFVKQIKLTNCLQRLT